MEYLDFYMREMTKGLGIPRKFLETSVVLPQMNYRQMMEHHESFKRSAEEARSDIADALAAVMFPPWTLAGMGKAEWLLTQLGKIE